MWHERNDSVTFERRMEKGGPLSAAGMLFWLGGEYVESAIRLFGNCGQGNLD